MGGEEQSTVDAAWPLHLWLGTVAWDPPGLSRTGLLCRCTTDMWGCVILSWDCPVCSSVLSCLWSPPEHPS